MNTPELDKKVVQGKLDLSKELTRRGLAFDADQLKRIQGIIDQYILTPDQIRLTLDKVKAANAREHIRNLPGYIHNTFRHTHTFQHKDYAKVDHER